ncbi:MAG: sensor histidine kinase, partial [Chitinophagales bacterium]
IIESHYPPIITIAYMRQIKNYLDVKKYKLALVHSTELKKYINKKDLKSLYNLLTLETQIYEAMQDYKKAFFTNKKCLEVLNKKTEIKDAAKLAESKIIYETEQKEKEKEKFKSESLRFQLQSLRSQMNPHFVFNAINSINGTLKPETIDESKSLLKSFARLMRSNLDFAERPKISLEEEIAFLHDYLSLEKNRLDDKMDYEIHFTENIDLDFIKIPSMLIQPYIENSIKHGILPLTDRKGKIGIYFEEKDDVLRCKVKDNGVGRKVAAIRQKTTEKHLGKSTKITENRLKLLTESKRQETVFVNYEDIENKEESTGTIVTLRIML